MRPARAARAVLVLLVGCAFIDEDHAASRRDMDGDGWQGDVDCDDLDPDVHPEAEEEACAGTDRDCDGVAGGQDDDGDGSPGCEDCDDADAARTPGNPEVCNDIDDNCDGAVDFEPSDGMVVYADADSDGWGDDAQVGVACAILQGFVDVGGDCDDLDAATHPEADEDCAEGDRDCDGDDDDGAADAVLYYLDGDGDEYGDAASTTMACSAPEGFVAAAGDCDDGDGAVSPGATEVCDDGVDNDCDGGPGSCGHSGEYGLGEAGEGYYGGEGDDFGWSLGGGEDLDGDLDGRDDFAVGAPSPDGGGRLTVFLSDGGSPGSTIVAPALPGEDGDEAGTSIAVGPGIATDGGVGILVGAPAGDTTEVDGGRVYLCEPDGPATFDCERNWLEGSVLEEEAGTAVSAPGDLDGDGTGDFLVGAPGQDGGASDAGAVYLFRSRPLVTAALSTLADALLTGEVAGDGAGGAISARAGDMDGDGLAEWLVGAPLADDSAGAIYVVAGDVSDSSLADATARLSGEAGGDFAGHALDIVGDVTGDGLADALMGASSESSGGSFAGAGYLVAGPASSGVLTSAHAKLVGDAGSYAGWSVSGLGDVDGDGRDDFAVGAPANAGAVYLFRSPPAGTVLLADADATFLGESAGDKAGWAIARGGQLDPDGNDDFLVGAYAFGTPDAGSAYVVLGTGL